MFAKITAKPLASLLDETARYLYLRYTTSEYQRCPCSEFSRAWATRRRHHQSRVELACNFTHERPLLDFTVRRLPFTYTSSFTLPSTSPPCLFYSQEKMDPGTALAVISLSVQLVTTVQSITKYLRTIRDAPSDLLAVIETLDQMQSNLNQVRYLLEQHSFDKRFTGSQVFILNALRTCERRVQSLSNLVDKVRGALTNRRLMKRAWASLYMRKEKTRVQELRSQLIDSIAGLQFAVSKNIWQLQ